MRLCWTPYRHLYDRLLFHNKQSRPVSLCPSLQPLFNMYGPRLAGVLAAVAVGPILIGFLLLWTWTIFKRHREELRQDLEEIRTLPSNERYNPRRIFPQPLFDENIEDAVGALQIHSKSFAWHCTKKCKTSQAIPLSRLQSHLHELGDGEHRLPAERLLELIPRQVRIFVSHIVITTVIEAITISEKSHLTILHPTPVALLTEVISHGDPDGDGRFQPFYYWKLLLIVWHRSQAEDHFRSPTTVHGIPASL